MKILELKAENVKRLSVVQIRPDGNLVEITGKNGAGKTSVLDAIWWALSGAANIQAQPVRKGADEARIELDLGELKVRRTFRREKEGTGFTTSIVVENADGSMRVSSPQKMLDGLWDAMSVDPLAFSRMKPHEQFETLKRFVPGIDFKEIAEAQRADFARRHDLNHAAKSARMRLKAIAEPGDAPPGRIDTTALVASLDDAGKQNLQIEARRARRVRDAERAIQRRKEAADFQAEADKFARRAKLVLDEAEEIEKELAQAPDLPELIDTAKIRERIAASGKSNDLFDRVQQARRDREQLELEARQAEDGAAALTRTMEAREAEKQRTIAAAALPVPGIAFGDGELLLDGVPFAQASDAEQLRASIAVAMASEPKLRVLRVRDGSLLDRESMELLARMADERDYQVWIETVQSGSPAVVHLVDGAIAEQKGAAA